MNPKTPRDKWSARQLLVALEKAERRLKEPTHETTELLAEAERARAREAVLLKELSAARGEATEAGVAGISVAGKPALSKYRRTWTDFSGAVLRLPRIRAEQGYGVARLVVSKDLDADLALFELDAPRGTIAARERDRLRRLLDAPSFVDLMMREGAGGDYLRATFLAQVVRAFFRPSLWRVYEKASDEGLLDRQGTVFK